MLTPYALHNLQIRKLAILAEMQEKLSEVAKQATQTEACLLGLVPTELRSYIEDECVVTTLIKFGSMSNKIYFNKSPFGDKHDVVRKIDKLRKSWRGQVVIRLGSLESNRISISYGIAQVPAS